MWDIIYNIVVCIVIIITSHYLFDYMKLYMTDMKENNIIEYQTEKYKNVIHELTESKSKSESNQEEVKLEEDNLLSYALEELETTN